MGHTWRAGILPGQGAGRAHSIQRVILPRKGKSPATNYGALATSYTLLACVSYQKERLAVQGRTNEPRNWYLCVRCLQHSQTSERLLTSTKTPYRFL